VEKEKELSNKKLSCNCLSRNEAEKGEKDERNGKLVEKGEGE
jgi:hypothetical protein